MTACADVLWMVCDHPWPLWPVCSFSCLWLSVQQTVTLFLEDFFVDNVFYNIATTFDKDLEAKLAS